MSESSHVNMKSVGIPLFIVVFLLGGLFFYSLGQEKQLVPSMRTAKPLPEFTAKKLFSDEEISSKDLRGQFVLLNFWGSWCPTCYIEHPYLMALKRQGITIIGVNYKDTEQKAKQFLDSQGDPYAYSFFDPKGRIAIEMGITAAPETFLISPEGKVLFHRVGDMNEKIFNQYIKPFLEGNN